MLLLLEVMPLLLNHNAELLLPLPCISELQLVLPRGTKLLSSQVGGVEFIVIPVVLMWIVTLLYFQPVSSITSCTYCELPKIFNELIRFFPPSAKLGLFLKLQN